MLLVQSPELLFWEAADGLEVVVGRRRRRRLASRAETEGF
jgi:hypothetical protein